MVYAAEVAKLVDASRLQRDVARRKLFDINALAEVAKLVDAYGLEPYVARLAGSSPAFGTHEKSTGWCFFHI